MIDILMATYNGEKYLRSQLDSILQQSNQNWRLIIRDDCSTDNTVAIIKEYQLMRPEQIILLQAEQPSGSAQNNFFELIQYYNQNSLAPYIMFADQDDVWLQQKIQLTLEQMQALEQQYGADKPLLVHTDLTVVDEKLRIINHSLFAMQQMDAGRNKLNNILVQNIVTGCTMMVNRALLQMVTKTPKQAIMHDMWLALIAVAFGEIGFVDRATMLYRQHGDNANGARNWKRIWTNIQILIQRQKIQNGLRKKCEQTLALLDCYEDRLSEEQQQVLLAYGTLNQKNIWEKYKTLRQYDLWMKGTAKKIGQILL